MAGTAGVAWHSRNVDVALSGTNLTRAEDFKLTRLGGGLTYGALPASAGGAGGTLPTNAIPLPGRQFVLSLTHHV